jgi:hypothetical protein
MQLTQDSRAVLEALFVLSSEGTSITHHRLSLTAQLGAPALVDALGILDHAGLADAQRLRLTLPGLAVAAALGKASSRSRTVWADRPRAA